ncbi:MAG: tape measure protein [Campylobacter sp.]|nr:tape measure protein [Campylobacter sp.]
MIKPTQILSLIKYSQHKNKSLKMDVANLSIIVKSSGAQKATEDINKLGRQAGQTQSNVDNLTASFRGLNTIIAALVSSALINDLIKTADEMSLVNSRLKMTTSSMNEFAKQQKAMHDIARTTHSSLKETTDLYVKLAPALKDLGKNTDEINKVTSSFAKALQLGGASAEESAAAIKQFGQAMGSGALRGDEFNSMAEASPTLLRYMAEGIGVPVGKLRELGAQGKLTAQVVSDALTKMSGKINEDFKNMPLTVGKAFTDLRTEVSLLVDDFNNAAGATGGIADGLTAIADWIGANRSDIIEFGLDVYRSFQLMGTVVLWLGTAVDNVFTAIPTAITLAIDAATTTISNKLNDIISEAEKAYNSVASLWDGQTRFGRIDISTSLSNGLTEHRKNLENEIELIQNQMSGLIKEIAENTVRANLAVTDNTDTINEKIKTTAATVIEVNQNLAKSLREISQIGLTEYENKLDNINQKYKEWIKNGVSASTALNAREKLINELNAEQTQQSLRQKQDIYKSYYEQIGDYAKLWEIEQSRLQAKLSGANITGSEVSGISPQQNGVTTIRQETATMASIMANEGSVRLQGYIRTFNETFFEPIFERLAFLVWKYGDPMFFAGYQRKDIPSFKVNINTGIGALNKEVQKKSLIDAGGLIVQQFGMCLQLGDQQGAARMQAANERLLLELLPLYGIKNADEFIGKKSELQKRLAPDKEQEQIPQQGLMNVTQYAEQAF